jgi:hypothetical protein
MRARSLVLLGLLVVPTSCSKKRGSTAPTGGDGGSTAAPDEPTHRGVCPIGEKDKMPDFGCTTACVDEALAAAGAPPQAFMPNERGPNVQQIASAQVGPMRVALIPAQADGCTDKPLETGVVFDGACFNGSSPFDDPTQEPGTRQLGLCMTVRAFDPGWIASDPGRVPDSIAAAYDEFCAAHGGSKSPACTQKVTEMANAACDAFEAIDFSQCPLP